MSGLMGLRFESSENTYLKKPSHAFGKTDDPDKELAALILKQETVNKLKEALSIGTLRREELSLASFQIERLEGSQGTVIRLESSYSVQQNLLLRCEGIVSDIGDQIKKFFDWLLSFFDGDDEKPVKREDTPGGEAKTPTAFEPPSLNGYFSYQNEKEAEKQITDVISNLTKLDAFLSAGNSFDYVASFKKGKEALFKEYFTEVFSKLPEVNVPKDDKTEAFKGKGFSLTEKAFYIFEATETTAVTGKKVKLTSLKDISELTIPKAIMGNTFSGKLRDLEFKIVELRAKHRDSYKKKITEVRAATASLKEDDALKPIGLIAGKLVKTGIGLLAELRNIRKALKGPLDILEAKDKADKDAKDAGETKQPEETPAETPDAPKPEEKKKSKPRKPKTPKPE